MNRGDTFINQAQQGVPSHLWIVLSDPVSFPDQIVIVNATTFRDYHDSTCLLNPGDHPFIQHKSCISYADAKVAQASNLRRLFGNGLLTSHSPVDEVLLQRIVEGALESRHTPIGCADVLRRQVAEE